MHARMHPRTTSVHRAHTLKHLYAATWDMAQDFGQQRQKHRADMAEYSQLSARAAAIEADISIGRDRSLYISIRSLYVSLFGGTILSPPSSEISPSHTTAFPEPFGQPRRRTHAHACTHAHIHAHLHARARTHALNHAYFPPHVLARSRVHVLSCSNKEEARATWRRSYNACKRESRCSSSLPFSTHALVSCRCQSFSASYIY